MAHTLTIIELNNAYDDVADTAMLTCERPRALTSQVSVTDIDLFILTAHFFFFGDPAGSNSGPVFEDPTGLNSGPVFKDSTGSNSGPVYEDPTG